MAKLSKLNENSSNADAVNALNAAHKTAPAQVELYDAGKGHGQGWKFMNGATVLASGSIPMGSHGEKNLVAALRVLIKAVDEHHIAD